MQVLLFAQVRPVSPYVWRRVAEYMLVRVARSEAQAQRPGGLGKLELSRCAYADSESLGHIIGNATNTSIRLYHPLISTAAAVQVN